MYIEVTSIINGNKILLPIKGLGVTVDDNITAVFVAKTSENYWEIKETYAEVKQMLLNAIPTFVTGVLDGN